MKILYFTDSLNCKDGWSKYSHDLITNIAKKNDVICLVAKNSPNVKIKQLEILKRPLKYLKIINVLLDSLKIRREIKRFNPEIIHFLCEPYAQFLFFIPSGYKTILTIHGTYALVPLKKRINLLAKYYYKEIWKIISVSNYTKSKLKEEFQKLFSKYHLKDKIHVITNGIEYEEQKIEKISSGKNAKKKILAVSTIKPRKGLVHTIEALNVYQKKYNSNFEFNIIGKFSKYNIYYNRILRIIKKYKLSDKIHFLGQVSAAILEKHYKESHLFIMPSVYVKGHFEGFGLVFLEANAYGLPVVGSINSGCQEAIKNGISGYAIEPSNYSEIAEKIFWILEEHRIKPNDCAQWAKKNDIKFKIPEIIKLYENAQ